jgi:hypothetical protein
MKRRLGGEAQQLAAQLVVEPFPVVGLGDEHEGVPGEIVVTTREQN